tara:strand:+ start:330 stop:542 length:213 start_codon:yes stop_codon:yes gene_type:complete
MQEACWYEGIYIVQRPSVRGGQKGFDVYLDIDVRGQVLRGKHLYQQNSKKLLETIEEAYRYSYKRFILKE